MNKNIRIAKQLVRLAKSLASTSRTASKSNMSEAQLAEEIKKRVGGDGFCIVLPSGMYLACEYVNLEDEEGLDYKGIDYNCEYETAIVSRVYDGGEPHHQGTWFADMNDIGAIICKQEGWEVEALNAEDIAAEALRIDAGIQIASFDDLKDICKDWGILPGMEVAEPHIDKAGFLSAVNSKIASEGVADAIEGTFNDLMDKLLGDYRYDYDFGYDDYDKGDDDPEKLEFLIKLNKLPDDEKPYYANACDCLYYGEGKREWFDNCQLSPERAQQVWDLAFEYMSHDWEIKLK